MSDPASILVSCDSPQLIVAARNEAIRKLPLELRRTFADVFTDYLFSYGLEGVYQRFNNRTVAQIIAEYEPGGSTVVESGEVDGKLYTMYEAPNQTDEDASE